MENWWHNQTVYPVSTPIPLIVLPDGQPAPGNDMGQASPLAALLRDLADEARKTSEGSWDEDAMPAWLT